MTTSNVYVRRSKCLNLCWTEEGLVFENYLTKSKLLANPLLTDMLGELTEFRSVEAIKGRFAGKELAEWDQTIQTLIEQAILVVRDSPQDKKEKILESWKWGQPARYLHFATKDIEFTFDPQGERRYFEELEKKEPPPSPYKDYPNAKFIALSSNDETVYTDPKENLSFLLNRRRTIREFKPEKISFQQLSTILSLTWGKTRSIDDGLVDKRILKTSPSGGCRHPIEVYVFVHRVEGVPKGVYHYSVRKNGLSLIGLGDFRQKTVQYCSGQPWVKEAAALFVMTAILERSMWRYRNSRAYRVVQLDAGHLGQTFHLVVTALGLGPVTTAAIQDSLIEEALNIDGLTEVAIYAAAAGIRKVQ